jgi:hypothetical protein
MPLFREKKFSSRKSGKTSKKTKRHFSEKNNFLRGKVEKLRNNKNATFPIKKVFVAKKWKNFGKTKNATFIREKVEKLRKLRKNKNRHFPEKKNFLREKVEKLRKKTKTPLFRENFIFSPKTLKNFEKKKKRHFS